MPYAEPTSPLPSPAKEYPSCKPLTPPPSHMEHAGPSSSLATRPMPGIPRRSSSSHSGSSTPRRGLSPAVSRQARGGHQFPTSRPMEGLPRRQSGSGTAALAISGLPSGEGSSLGLKLLPSPVKSTPPRIPKDSMSSTSTIESSLPPTPADEPRELPLANGTTETMEQPVSFPKFEPAPRSAMPSRSAMSPSRPTLLNSRRSGTPMGHRRHDHSGSLQISFPSSSSSPHLPTPPPQPSPQPSRPVSMIRKKSGEVVKPSLKQRSMSTPDLTRQSEQSDPPTPEQDKHRGFPEERSKSVRFAGAEDETGALENVVLFLREQKVTAVGKAADPDRAGLPSDTDNTDMDTEMDSDYVSFRTRRNAAAKAADEAERIQLEGGSRVPRLRVDFAPNARGALANENIVLERVELQTTSGPLTLKGTAIVRNVAFQKWVAVRFTLDHWQTVSEVSGSHVCHIPPATTGDEGWDRFTFSIKLEDYKRKIDERQLILCIRFSVEGHEWWDSNNGMNYNFTFKKAAPRRPTRTSGPATFGGGFMRLNDAASSTIPLRQNRGVLPSTQISRAFGVPSSSDRETGPRNWVFPKLASHMADGPPPRPDSPVSRPPAASFRAPAPPDVHTHLSLSKYCAPSPPQSPQKEREFAVPTALPTPLVLSPEADGQGSPLQPMKPLGGQFATLDEPQPHVPPEHERRSSWNGNHSTSWEFFSKAMFDSAETPSMSTDGETTPVAHGSRSPMVDTHVEASPEHKPLTMKRSTGDLRSLVTDDADLITPPSSNLSSPPSPAAALLGELMSPSPSATSTGESSPINTISAESTPDLSTFPLQIDPDEHRGRPGFPANSYKMLSNSYQEFLDKFCFFQSPRMTPVEEPIYNRPSHIPLSGHASPSGFPFFASNSSNSPRSTPTPTRQYDSSRDAFNFASVPMPFVPGTTYTGQSSTPHVHPAHHVAAAKSTPARVGSPDKGQQLASYSSGPGHHWAKELHDKASPTLTAAQ